MGVKEEESERERGKGCGSSGTVVWYGMVYGGSSSTVLE